VSVRLYSLLSNDYKLDGGAMFGNAPKALWERWLPADEQNRIALATRALLAVTPKQTILFEAGIGAYLDPNFKMRYGVKQHEHMLLRSLQERSVSHEDVTDIVISHLHFDHAGGLLSAWEEGKESALLFPRAKFHVGQAAWQRATHPHPRDRASFIPLLHRQLEQSGRLHLVISSEMLSFDGLEVRFFPSEGHTPGLLCADLRFDGGRLVFPSDLIPGSAWVHLPISMGYDRFPEQVINEKTDLLSSLAEDNAWICYVHDPQVAASKVRWNEAHTTFIVTDARQDLIL
jgi:glyoxylase-like metal-dependent hydrolase (beta-lactamase superfamily II)